MSDICFIGGDARNCLLAKMFEEDGKSVIRCGLKGQNVSFEEIKLLSYDIIITAIPFSNDKVTVNSSLEEKILIEDFIANIKCKTIYGGKFAPDILKRLEENGNKVIDVMKINELAIKNAIPTAEGVIKIIIENTDITINDSNIAILGFGKVGKKVSELLKKLGANIFVYDINQEEVANIKMYGYNVLKDISDGLTGKDVIVNTVPEVIINQTNFDKIMKETLIIDIASKPGGIDYSYQNINDYKCIQALRLPGKIAPKTAAKYIKDIIESYSNMRC